MYVYLDDVRPKPADFDIKVTTAQEAIELLKTGEVELISLDYDLGGDGDEGETVAKWIEEQAYANKLKRLKVLFHTDNPVGRERMRVAIVNAERYWRMWEGATVGYEGRLITNAEFDEDYLRLTFSDGVIVTLTDNKQSCCEYRYMTTDDDVASLIGGHLAHIKLKKFEEGEPARKDEMHEICFVEVQTDKGFITIATHNEHNGCYGGFSLCLIESNGKRVALDTP